MSLNTLFVVKSLVAPKHNRLNRQEDVEWFTDEGSARQARFLLAIEVAAEQGLLDELIDQFDLEVEPVVTDPEKRLALLASAASEYYDDIVDVIVNSLRADEMTDCYFNLETIDLQSQVDASKKQLAERQAAYKLPVMVSDRDRLDHVLDAMMTARQQLNANPNMSAQALFNCCSNAFATLEKARDQVS